MNTLIYLVSLRTYGYFLTSFLIGNNAILNNLIISEKTIDVKMKSDLTIGKIHKAKKVKTGKITRKVTSELAQCLRPLFSIKIDKKR